jgi:hypothetical protein
LFLIFVILGHPPTHLCTPPYVNIEYWYLPI